MNITHAMILAAGRGQRMSPITDKIPKPLIDVAGKPLLAYHLEKLSDLGIKCVTINHAWLGEQICDYVGDGSQFGVDVKYSAEQPALETAGGIAKALPLLGEKPFLVINGDVWTDFKLSQIKPLEDDDFAHLVMVSNPEHNIQGDFSLEHDRVLNEEGLQKLTFSGIAIYRPSFFEHVPQAPEPLAPWIRHWIKKGKVSGQHYPGNWCDVGTPQRLELLEQELS